MHSTEGAVKPPASCVKASAWLRLSTVGSWTIVRNVLRCQTGTQNQRANIGGQTFAIAPCPRSLAVCLWEWDPLDGRLIYDAATDPVPIMGRVVYTYAAASRAIV